MNYAGLPNVPLMRLASGPDPQGKPWVLVVFFACFFGQGFRVEGFGIRDLEVYDGFRCVSKSFTLR